MPSLMQVTFYYRMAKRAQFIQYIVNKYRSMNANPAKYTIFNG